MTMTAHLLACAAMLTFATPAISVETDAHSFSAQVDALVDSSFDRPSIAVAASEHLHVENRGALDETRILLQAIGIVHAREGAGALAATGAKRMLLLAREEPTHRTLTGVSLVRAYDAESEGQINVSAKAAKSALRIVQTGCAAPETSISPPERVLIADTGIASIKMGRIAEGKRDMACVLALWQQAGDSDRQAETLRRFGEALENAGDFRGALELYHSERAITEELMRVNRSVTLKDLQLRNDADARQRAIGLLERDNALKTARLVNHDLMQKIWWVLAALMTLVLALCAALYRRVREGHRQLAANEVQLRAQSERDPLTNLANRRHLQSKLASLDASNGFTGALLVVDIDHFKRVNDIHGHAAGDHVLVEVANRLTRTVRGDDLVVRWGGEEFLILAPGATAEQAEQIAMRVLAVIGEMPIDAGVASLRVTASAGYARFPLVPNSMDVPWEQAINLVDGALYTAKKQGRNRSVGVIATTAFSANALRNIGAEFEQASRDGRVRLLESLGPSLPKA